MVKFTTRLLKTEKDNSSMSGWIYIVIPADIAQQLKPGNKKEFKVKGKLDNYVLSRTSLSPTGGGHFMLPVNAAMRKVIRKKEGAMVSVQMEVDESAYVFNADFMDCLADDPEAKAHFESLSGAHQRYFGKWIDSAKTEETKVKRIALAISSLGKKWDYGQMIRSQKKE